MTLSELLSILLRAHTPCLHKSTSLVRPNPPTPRQMAVPSSLLPGFRTSYVETITIATLGTSGPTTETITSTVQSRLQTTNAVASTSTPALTSSSGTSASGHHNSTAANSTQSPQSKNHGSGLSTGAAIGIGIAIAVFVLEALCALGFLCYRGHKKRRRERSSPQTDHASTTDQASNHSSAKQKIRGDSEHKLVKSGSIRPPYELSGRPKAGEMATNANRHELESSSWNERSHELAG